MKPQNPGPISGIPRHPQPKRFLMRPHRLVLLGSVLTLASLGGCKRDGAPKPPASPVAAPAPMMAPAAPAAPATSMASGTVIETMDAANYTYVRVKTSSGEIWAATGQFKVAVGDKVSVPLEMPMENFHSNTLNRTFPIIYFASHIERQGAPGTK